MNFIIYGTGAIGSYLGGRLAAAGEEVTFIARPNQRQAMLDRGLRITDLDGFRADLPAGSLAVVPDVQSALARLSPEDKASAVILLCVKGGATQGAAADMAACAPAGTVVVSFQNGVENVTRIQAAAHQGNSQLKALAGMVPYNVVMQSGNHVHRATGGKLQLQASEQSNDIAKRFTAAGIAIRVTSDMRSVQWGKLLLNLNNPINALSNLPLREQLLDRNYRVVLSALQREALSAMALDGIVPAQLAQASPRAMTYLLRLPNVIFTRLATKMLRMDPSARSSMWDDVQKGKITEVDDLCGAVVRLAAKHGRTAPYNAKMCELMATHRKGQRIGGRALRRAFGI
jgi:2-dehydropantoate 2-reductase